MLSLLINLFLSHSPQVQRFFQNELAIAFEVEKYQRSNKFLRKNMQGYGDD